MNCTERYNLLITWKNISRLFLFSGLILIFIISGCGRKNEKIVAQVNGEKLMAQDFIEFYKTRPRVADWTSRSGKLDPNQVMDALIDKVLMTQEAIKTGLDRLPGFDKQLDGLKEQELANLFVKKWFDTKIDISDEEIEKAIPDYKKKEIKFARICVLTESMAWEIKKELDEGGDFSYLARTKSIGMEAENGGVGDFLSPHRGIYHKDVIEAIFNLQIGEISPPQKIREGFAIFKPVEERPIDPSELDQIMQYQKSLIFREKRNRLITDFLDKAKKTRNVMINNNAIKEISSMGTPFQEHYDPVLAEGKGFKISWGDLKTLLPKPGQGEKAIWEDPNLLSSIVESRIRQRLIVLEAQKKGFDKDPDLNRELTRFKQDFLSRQLIVNDVESKIVVTEDECQKYYQENPGLFFEPEMAKISHILIKDKQKAQEILSRLKIGEDFAKLAKEHSEYKATSIRYGDMGFIRQGQSGMGQEFDQKAFSLQKGEISDLVETPFGYQIIYVTERTPAGVIPFEKAKDKIRQELINQKRQGHFRSYLNVLRSKANIIIDEKLFAEISHGLD
ncbi:peptidyl-prolyl cis-trans isomerase [bacterium]|nr:peptidyl-prolyl cis-trans isomerase [bacterium]